MADRNQPTRIVGYINPKYVKLMNEDDKENKIPKSKIIKEAIKMYYENKKAS